MAVPYDIVGRALYPLGDLLDLADFPLADFIPASSLSSVFDGLYYTEAAAYDRGDNLVLDVRLAFEQELVLSPPGTDAIALVFGSGGVGWTTIDVQIVIGPDFSITLRDATVGLRISKDVLQDVATSAPAEIEISADIHFSPAGIVVDHFTGATLRPAYLCGSKIVVEAADVRPVFGPISPPTFLSDQPGFQGIAIQELKVTLPPEFIQTDPGADLAISLTNAAIGTTGFTGKITIASTDLKHPVTGTVLGFPFRFRQFTLDIHENAFVDVSLGADVRLEALEDGPKQKWVALDFTFGAGGAFTGSLAAAQPPEAASTPGALVEFEYSGVLHFDVRKVRVTRRDQLWALYFSGSLKLLLDGTVTWPTIAFDEIGVNSKKEFLLPDGAGITFATPLIVNWQFVRLTVSKFRFGYADTTHTKLRLGLAAEVMLLDGVPAGVSVEGLIVEWTPGSGAKPDVSFTGIGLAFGVPGSFNASLYVSYVEAGGAVEFRGKGSLALTALDMQIDVGIVVGLQKAVPPTYPDEFVYLYLFADAKLLPTGIPIDGTGLSIYGFQGLVAYNMALSVNQALPVDERYYELFTRAPIGITDVSKWQRREGQNALGVGVVLGTADKGFSVNVKGLLVVAFPDLTILLQAKANFLKLKPDLGTAEEGNLAALLVYASGQSTLSLDIVAHWSIPKVVTVDGSARAFYSFADPTAWYLEIGRDQDGKRVVAKALQWNDNWLFTAGFWFRLDRQGVVTGVKIDVALHAEKAGFWVDASGHARGQMALYWEPSQWEGSLELSGQIKAGVSSFSVGITLSGNARARVHHPFDVHVRVEACVDIIVKKVCKGFDFDWAQIDPPELEAPIRRWAATPRHWTPYDESQPGAATKQLNTGVVSLAPGGGAVTIHPHSVLSLDFAKPMVDSTSAFNEAVALDDEGFVTIGEHSGWSAAYRLDSVTVVRDPAGANQTIQVWGTWARETLQPNTTLRLSSSERFGHDGSLTNSFLESADLDYCDMPTDTIKCVPLGGIEPGYGWLDDGSIYHWQTTGTGTPKDNGGIVLGPNDTIEVVLPGPTGQVTVGTTNPSDPTADLPPWVRHLCALGTCRLVVIAALAAIIVVLLLALALSVRPLRVPALILALVLDVIALAALALVWLCRCRHRRLCAPSGSGAGSSGGGTGSTGGTGSGGSGGGSSGTGGGGAAGGTDEHIPVPTQPGGVVVVTGQTTGGVPVTEVCYPPGHGTPKWGDVSQRGGTTTEYEAWNVPASMKIFAPNEHYELRAGFTARLRAPDGSVSEPLGSAVAVVAPFDTSGPPDREGALRDYVANMYPYDGARPVYTGYDLTVTFVDEYVPYLYASVSEQLMIRLFDGQGEPLLDAGGQALLLPASTVGPSEHTVTQQVWEEIYQRNVDSGCVDGQPIKTTGTTVLQLSAAAAGADLTANSQYAAQLVSDARPDVALAAWGFTTSRYKTFSDLVTTDRVMQLSRVAVASLTPATFDALSRTAGVPSIAYVEQTTVTPILNQAKTRCVALLLEAPEPLDFVARLTTTVAGAPTQFVANADQTRGFILPAGGSDWPLDLLAVVLTWRRDAGAGVPRLAVAGDTTAEVVSFSVDLRGLP